MNDMKRLINKQLITKMFTVSFEGNIGSGKTSSLNYLSKKSNKVIVMSEPIEKWLNLKGYNLVELLYKDINRWSFAFEHYAQLTRLQMYENTQNSQLLKGVRLMERSIFSARHCFTENLFQSGNLTKPEYIVIDEWFKWLSNKNDCKVDLIVYLRASPETVYQRIKKRSRDEEMEIPLEYLQSLHKLHDEWLLSDQRSDSTPVLTINADLDQKQVFESLDQYSKTIFGNGF